MTAVDLNKEIDLVQKMGIDCDEDNFVADSGASTHLTGSLRGMTNLKNLKNDLVTIENYREHELRKIVT